MTAGIRPQSAEMAEIRLSFVGANISLFGR
jgi:hypothetical protein